MEELVKKLKKCGTADLLKKVEKFTGMEKEACIEVLKQRGQDVTKFEVAKKQEVPATSSVVYEFEDEQELTPEEKKLLKSVGKKEKEPKAKKEKVLKEKTIKVPKEKVAKIKKEKVPGEKTQSEKIKELAATGKSKTEIAKELDVRYQFVFNVLKVKKA